MSTNPTQVKARDLAVGTWISTGDGPAEVLLAQPFTDVDGPGFYLTYRFANGAIRSYESLVDELFQIVTETELTYLKAAAERARKFADMRSLLSWLENNPGLPLPHLGMQVSPGLDGLSELDVWNSGAEGVAELKRWAEIMGEPLRLVDDQHTEVVKSFGQVEYRAIAWHKDGRPAEPVRCVASLHITTEGLTCSRCGAEGMTYDDGSRDQLGLNYTRADDEPDDPTPVSPARAEPHAGSVLSGIAEDGHKLGAPGKPVDETGDYWDPSVTSVPVANYEPGLIVGDTAEEQTSNAYAAYERDEAECPSAWHVNQGDKRSRCPICNQAD